MNGKLYVNEEFKSNIKKINIEQNKCTFTVYPTDLQSENFSELVQKKLQIEFENGKKYNFFFESFESNNFDPIIVKGYI